MHPTLLVGPADWDPARLPREEFAARLTALWESDPSADGAIIYGDSRHHGELAWLTHFTPKLEAGLALLARSGEARLLVGGGANMLPAARPLTWIDSLAPLRNAAPAIAEWTRGLGAKRLTLVGGGAMPASLRRAVLDGLGAVAWEDGSARVRRMMRVKRACELALIREACVMLDAAVTALAAAKQGGATASAAILAAEQAAFRRGAQDVRTLFSLDRGRSLRPFGVPTETTVDPLQAYLAVRHAGYWAEGFVMPAAEPGPALDRARAALRSALALASRGTPRGELAQVLAGGAPHPVADPAVVSMGLSLDDGEGSEDALSAGEVLSLRAGISDSAGAAIVSAMIAVHADRVELLWKTPPIGQTTDA